MRPLGRALTLGGLAAGLAGGGVLWGAARSRPVVSEGPSPEPPAGLPDARIVHVPGRGELFVREAGDRQRPAVLLVHGWMATADLNWFACYGPLAQSFHVVATDVRGHGRGPRPSAPFRLADVADDLAALITHLELGPVVAVGYSMGGPIVEILKSRHPELVRGLVLSACSPTFLYGTVQRMIFRGMGMLQLLLRLLPRHVWEDLVERQARGTLPVRVTRLITEDTPPELIDLLPWISSEMARGSPEDLAEAGRELGRYDARARLAEMDAPTAVLIASKDQIVPPAQQEALAELVPHARVYRLPIDHDGPVARRHLFARTLVAAINELLATPQLAAGQAPAGPSRDAHLRQQQ